MHGDLGKSSLEGELCFKTPVLEVATWAAGESPCLIKSPNVIPIDNLLLFYQQFDV